MFHVGTEQTNSKQGHVKRLFFFILLEKLDEQKLDLYNKYALSLPLITKLNEYAYRKPNI
jgi:hypothetical protein